MKLTRFEQVTLEQLVSYKANDDKDIPRLLSCEKLKKQVVSLCKKWNKTRKSKSLEPWK